MADKLAAKLGKRKTTTARIQASACRYLWKHGPGPHLRVTRAALKSAGCPGAYLPTLVDTTTFSRGSSRRPRPSSCAPAQPVFS